MLLRNQPKIIAVTGGEIGGIDNGIIAASIGYLLKANGYNITMIIMDACINNTSDNLNPSLYGEHYCTFDGSLVPVNIGNYERILDQLFSGDNNITKGKIYEFINNNERRYDGYKVGTDGFIASTIQWIQKIFDSPIVGTETLPDICIIEIADIKDEEFRTVLKRLKYNRAENSFLHIHLSKLVNKSFGLLTKSVQLFREKNCKVDMVIFRSNVSTDDDILNENVEYAILKENVDKIINLPNVSNIKNIPILLQERNVHASIVAKFGLGNGENFETKMEKLQQEIIMEESYTDVVKIVILGKYYIYSEDIDQFMEVNAQKSYQSMVQQLTIAAASTGCKVEIILIWAQDLEDGAPPEKQNKAWGLLKTAYAILVPAGLKEEGFTGILKALNYARVYKIPCLSICYGMQAAVIEFALNKLGIVDKWPFSKVLHEQLENGQRRSGTRVVTLLRKDSQLYGLYDEKNYIYERSCNRDEIKPEIVRAAVREGLQFGGIGFDEDGKGNYLPSSQPLMNIARLFDKSEMQQYYEAIDKLCHESVAKKIPLRMQIFELDDHPYYVGIQYHAKCGLRPSLPSPPFVGLLLAARRQKNELLQASSSSSCPPRGRRFGFNVKNVFKFR